MYFPVKHQVAWLPTAIKKKTIVKTMGMAPAILEGIGKALQKIGLPDFGVSEAVQKH